MLAADCLFFLSLRALPAVLAGVLFGYALLFWSITLLYQWPLLVEQETGARAVLKKSALMALDNIGFSLFTGALLLALTLLSWALVLPALLLWPAFAAFLQTRATRDLLRRYGLLPPEIDPNLEPADDERWGVGWHE